METKNETRKIAIDQYDFSVMAESDTFYVDKTLFIQKWYRTKNVVTLITRPRRFGKTLTMNMVERFFSNRYHGQPEPFMNLEIGKNQKMMDLQGTMPVISITLMSVCGTTYESLLKEFDSLIRRIFRQYRYLADSTRLYNDDKEFISYMSTQKKNEAGEYITLEEEEICESLIRLSEILFTEYGKKAIILLDEYDTPLQAAYLNNYWNKAAGFFGTFFKKSFKENHFLHKALITGISRVSKESLFSPFNNPAMCSVTSPFFEDAFGFTQGEVDAALTEFGLMDKREDVKLWYDGYQFGNKSGIYNPWSISNFLSAREIAGYWANSASNAIVSHVIQHSSIGLKDKFIDLMQGRNITAVVDEDTTYMTLFAGEEVIWGLLLACGYLKAVKKEGTEYTLAIVNHEVREMMDRIILAWFRTEDDKVSYDWFVDSLLRLDEEKMNETLSALAIELFGNLGTSNHEGRHYAENFYHGFVLGLVTSLRQRYVIESNRESGYGRFDIMLVPLRKDDNGIIIEFKVFNPKKEKKLDNTCLRALQQIDEKKYDVELKKHGIPDERIFKFGIGFKRKQVLVKKKQH